MTDKDLTFPSIDGIFFEVASPEYIATLKARLDEEKRQRRIEAAERMKLSPLRGASLQEKQAYVLEALKNLLGVAAAAEEADVIDSLSEEDLHVQIVALEDMERSFKELEDLMSGRSPALDGPSDL